MAFYMKMGSKSLKTSGINMNGSPLPRVTCADGTPPPCASQGTANAAAEVSVNNAPKIFDGDFKEIKRTKVAGGTEISFERNYTQKGTGEATKSYKQLKNEGGDVKAARKWNAERNKSGTETKTRMIHDPITLDPMPMKVPSLKPEAGPVPSINTEKFAPVPIPAAQNKTSKRGGNSTAKPLKVPKQKNSKGLIQAKVEDFFKGKGPCGGTDC